MIKIKKVEFQKLYDIACSTWQTKFNEKFKKFLFSDSDSIEFEESYLEEMQKACDTKQLKVFMTIFKGQIKESKIAKVIPYKDICKHLDRPVLTMSHFSFLPENQRKKAFRANRIGNLQDYFNDGWVPNWKDGNERKWWPYFVKRAGSWAFHRSDFSVGSSAGRVGFYRIEEISNFVGRNYLTEYEEYLD